MKRPQVNNKPMSYSQVLRTLGTYLDNHHLQEMRILEGADAIILQGLATQGDHAGERVTYELTEDDIYDLYLDQTAQRGKRVA